MNEAMVKWIKDVVLQKVSKTCSFVPDSELMKRACGVVMNLLETLTLLGNTEEAKSNGEEFVEMHKETHCKAFNHVCTYVQQQMPKEIIVLLKGANNPKKEVPVADEIKEMFLHTYPRAKEFMRVKQALDAEGKIRSLQSERIGIHL